MASSLTRPTTITTPFAEAGRKRVIPTASQIGITDGQASYTDGFPPLTMTPLASGGIPPAGMDFNGIFNAITSHLRYTNGGGLPKFDTDLSAKVGGYPVGAVLQDDLGKNSYINIVDGNSTNFNSNPASIGTLWMPFGGLNFINSRPGHTYSSSDWCYLDKSRGLILQWTSGTTSATNGADSTITLPTSFASSNLIAFACFNSGATPYYDLTTPVFVTGKTVSTVVVRGYTGDANGVNVFAIGY